MVWKHFAAITAGLGFVAGMSSPAAARWFEASSPNFVVYADDSQADIQRFAEQLERYRAAMDFITVGDEPVVSPSNRVTVYVLKSESEVRKLHGGGDGSRYVQGFYVPRAGESYAFVPTVQSSTSGRLADGMRILLHEYAHHFAISSADVALPRWLSEGSAEFFSSAEFLKDGGVSIGRPAFHRANDFAYAKDVRVHDLLDPDGYEKKQVKGYDAYYAKSWLLYHYLAFEKKRQGQLARYLQNMNDGRSHLDAARTAFGDFDILEKELDTYLHARKMPSFNLSATALKPGKVVVRPLREGEAAMMGVRMRSKRGVNRQTAQPILTEARAIAGRFPTDAAVLTALAEAEVDAGNNKEAVMAADAAIAIDPAQYNAYFQKGLALFRIAATAPDRTQAYKVARRPFVALNKLENDNPLPLIYYYRSFASQGLSPSPLAVQGLERAVEIAPFDKGLRMNLARQQIREKRYDAAKMTLRPVATDPHGGPLAAIAKALMDKLNAGVPAATEAAILADGSPQEEE